MYDVIVIGGGPAGMTAALYLARKKMKIVLLAVDSGGQTAKAASVENYPGFEKISGVELVEKMVQQLKNLNIESNLEEVREIKKITGGFSIVTKNETYDGRALIICSGKTHRKLGVPGEEEFIGKGVSYCATCDGPLFRDKAVVVVGGGNSALDAAIEIEKYAKSVTILNISAAMQADAIMVEKFEKSPKGKIICNIKVQEIYGDQLVKGLKYEDQETKKMIDLPCDGIFVEVGWTPSTDFVNDLVKLNQLKEIEVDKTGATSLTGIFAAGDVTDTPFKQIVIAAGEGAKAALSTWKWLLTQKN